MALVTDPLRATAGRQGTGQPAAHHGVVHALAAFDGGHDRQGAGGRRGFDQRSHCPPRAGEIFGGDVQFGGKHDGFGMLGANLQQRAEAVKPLLRGFRWRYFGKGRGQIGVGLGGSALYYAAIREPDQMLVHAVKFAVQLPFSELVFIACCFLWIGFDSSLHLILLRVAGVQALVGLVAILAGFLPFGMFVSGVVVLLAYIGMMSESLELDFQDAVLVGIATYGTQIIIGLMIIGYLVAHM